MKRQIGIAILAVMGLGSLTTQANENTPAYNMMIINDTSWGDRETVEKRFA